MPLSGSRMGPYEIKGPLGAGGMGEVYRAHDPRLRRDVAVKIIAGHTDASGDPRRGFEDEARAASALNHPNILSVFDVLFDQEPACVVFELLEGQTLGERLRSGPLPHRKAVDHAVRIAQGLAAAHAKGIVHRDLKPDNVFLTRDGQVKILDFGLAKLTQDLGPDENSLPERVTRTAPGLIVGTLAYMSPEQARGGRADARSDIFSLGPILYEMLSGRPAFNRASAAETLSAVLDHDPAPLRTHGDNAVPPALGEIVRRCLEKDPQERFQSAPDLAFSLARLSGSARADQDARPG